MDGFRQASFYFTGQVLCELVVVLRGAEVHVEVDDGMRRPGDVQSLEEFLPSLKDGLQRRDHQGLSEAARTGEEKHMAVWVCDQSVQISGLSMYFCPC